VVSIFKWELEKRFKEGRKSNELHKYIYISVIMGNWKNRLKSRSTVIHHLTRVRENSKTKFKPKWNTKQCEKKNQYLYIGSLNSIVIFNWKIVKVNFQTMSIYLENIVILWILDITSPIWIHMFHNKRTALSWS
jgi:hypothetical protein